MKTSSIQKQITPPKDATIATIKELCPLGFSTQAFNCFPEDTLLGKHLISYWTGTGRVMKRTSRCLAPNPLPHLPAADILPFCIHYCAPKSKYNCLSFIALKGSSLPAFQSTMSITDTQWNAVIELVNWDNMEIVKEKLVYVFLQYMPPTPLSLEICPNF